jgi:hypothetical protein
MERLALSLWLALTVGTLAGAPAARHQAPLRASFPKLPVPAGDSLSEGRVELGRRSFHDRQLTHTTGIGCANCNATQGEPS